MTILFLEQQIMKSFKCFLTKIGKKISETLFYRLKKEAERKRGESEEWLDYYARYQFVEFYRKRMEELEFVQRKLLKVLIEEKRKEKIKINYNQSDIQNNSRKFKCPS